LLVSKSVSCLSTEAFLDVFDQFVTRRGLSESIDSDNGSIYCSYLRKVAEFLKVDHHHLYDYFDTQTNNNWLY